MEEIRNKVLEGLKKMVVPDEIASTVALCGGETDIEKQATIIATHIWEKEEAKRTLVKFAITEEELANCKVVSVAEFEAEYNKIPAADRLAEDITETIRIMETGYPSFNQIKLMWENHQKKQPIDLDTLEDYASSYANQASNLARMLLCYKYETKQ
jgi:hypothetical protein